MDFITIDDIKIHKKLIEFRDLILQKHPHYVFKPTESEKTHNGIVGYFSVYADHEPEFRIGSIGYDVQNKQWWIGGIYDDMSGKWHWISPDYVRTSIDMKRLCRFVKDMLVFPTMKKYSQSIHAQAMHNHVHKVRSEDSWNFEQETHDLPEETYQDFFKLAEMNYQPISKEFKNIMKTIVRESKAIVEKRKYNPSYCHVWVRKSSITYVLLDYNDTIPVDEKTVASRKDLPMPIQEKMAILDLMEISGGVHDDIGAKERPDFYTVFA